MYKQLLLTAVLAVLPVLASADDLDLGPASQPSAVSWSGDAASASAPGPGADGAITALGSEGGRTACLSCSLADIPSPFRHSIRPMLPGISANGECAADSARERYGTDLIE